MKKFILAIVLVLILSLSAFAVPYPYGDYEVKTGGDLKEIYDQVELKYRVDMQSEKNTLYPWSEYSFAVLNGPEVEDAKLNYEADMNFWSSTEKAEKRKQRFGLFVDKEINFSLLLVADSDTDYGFRYVEPKGHNTYISRIMLETDTGERHEPIYVSDSDADMVAGRWMSVCSISFDRYADGKQIIDENTEWIKLWIVAGTSRVYFKFDFE